MRKLLIIILTLTYSIANAQNNNDSYLKTFDDLKSKSKIDKSDTTSLEVINNFYHDVLQSDKGELGSNTINKLQKFMTSPDAKNKYLIEIFLMYLQHISETAAKNLKTNPDFQVANMKYLKSEFEELYRRTPAIIFIYNSEALESAQRIEEAKKLMANSEMDRLSLLGIGFSVGFNSKTAFNRAFKKMTSQSPREYFFDSRAEE